jgi:tetratricopeptide (TPR) repeat protein
MARLNSGSFNRFEELIPSILRSCAACWLLSWLLAACASSNPLAVPAVLHSLPGQGDQARALQAAQEQADRQRPAVALGMVEKLLAKYPHYVDAQRLRQNLLQERGRLGLVLHEAEQRLTTDPGARSFYLKGRVQGKNADKRQAFQAAVDLDPEFFWGWFGLAFTLRVDNPKASKDLYRHLYETSKNEARLADAYAAALVSAGETDEAVEVYRQVGIRNPGRGALGIARLRLQSGRLADVWPELMEAIRHRYHDPNLAGLLEVLLARDHYGDKIEVVLDLLRRDPAVLDEFARLHGGLLSRLFAKAGNPLGALSVVGRPAALLPADRVLYRKLLITSGDIVGFLGDLRWSFEPEFLQDAGNQVMARWRSLAGGLWMGSQDPLETLESSLALTRSLIGVGYLEFAELIATRALLRHARLDGGALAEKSRDSLRQARSDVRREIAFESSLRRILRTASRTHSGGKTLALADVFEQLRRMSIQVLGRDVVGDPELFSVPFVGVLVDALGPGLPAHLASFNKHLVMGQRTGQPVEGMILTRLSLRHVDPVAGFPLPPRCTEVVGEHRELEPLNQADLAGIALLNHYVIDMDEVRLWAARIVDRRRAARQDDLALLGDPLPTELGDLEPAGVEWRLALMSPVEDKDMDAAVLDVIRWHERGHMVDFQRLLPVTSNVLRSLSLVMRNGWDALQVTAEMEGRAQLAALAMSPFTKVALAHTAGFLGGEDGGSPHAIGFRKMVSRLQERLRAAGVKDPRASRWHELEPAVLRENARRLLRSDW